MNKEGITRKEFEELKKKVESLGPSKKLPRKPTEYNIFMSTEIKRINEEEPSVDAKDRFKKATESWNKLKTSKKTS